MLSKPLPTDITSLAEVISFFELLAQEGCLFHIDDDPRDEYDMTTDERMFTDEQADRLDSLITQCFAHTEDPYHYAVEAFHKFINR